MKRALLAAIGLIILGVPALAQNAGNEYAWRAPTRFYKPVRFSMGRGLLSSPYPQNMNGVGQISSLSAVANSSTTLTVARTVTLLPYTLVSTGQELHIRVSGTTAANANNKVINFLFGSTTIVLLNAASNAKDFYADVVIYRTAANAQQISVQGYANGAVLNGLSVTSAQAENAAITLGVSVPATTGAADVVINGMTVTGEVSN